MALLLVLWIFVVLFVVVLDFASSMRDDGLATANLADETQVYYVALAGINRAVYDVLAQLEEDPDAFGNPLDEAPLAGDDDDDDDRDPLGLGSDAALQDLTDALEDDAVTADGRWHEGNFGGGTYAVRLLDESSKISLNRATEPLLMRVVRRLLVGGNATEGVSVDEEREVSTIVSSILDWRDPDDLEHPSGHGAEADYYARLPRPYPIKNGPFDSVEELLLVRGVTPELFYGSEEEPGLREIFSADSRTPHINIMQAPAAVLRVLLDVDEVTAQELLAEREEVPLGFVERMREQLMAVDPSLAPLLRSIPSPVVTVEARAMTGERNVAHVAAIMDLSDTFEGPLVLRWFDRVPAGWGGPDETETEDDGDGDGAADEGV